MLNLYSGKLAATLIYIKYILNILKYTLLFILNCIILDILNSYIYLKYQNVLCYLIQFNLMFIECPFYKMLISTRRGMRD